MFEAEKCGLHWGIHNIEATKKPTEIADHIYDIILKGRGTGKDRKAEVIAYIEAQLSRISDLERAIDDLLTVEKK